MRKCLFYSAICAGILGASFGQSSEDYRLQHSTLDLGGARQSSVIYTLDGSLGSFGGAVISASQTVRAGFAGQLNEPPRAGTDGVQRIAGKAAKIFIPDLLVNDSDLEENAFFFAGAAAVSANGAEVLVDGNWLIYGSTDAAEGMDTIQYFLIDDHGGMVSGEIFVTSVGSETGTLLTLLRIEVLNNGALKRIGFVGIGGRNYRIQASNDLAEPDWQTIGTATAEANGVYWFEDTEALPARFYRSVAF